MMQVPALPGDWHACLVAFLQSVLSRSGSVQSYETYLSVLTRFFASGMHPEQVSRADILTFLDARATRSNMRGQIVSAHARNQRLAVLKSFYTFASLYEVKQSDGTVAPLYQKANPTAGMRAVKIGSKPRALSAAEVERFFSVIPKDTPQGARDRAIFLMYFWTGRRRSEIARLAWGDIEQAVIVEPDGTRRVGHLYHYYAKGNSRERKVAELPGPAWTAIERYLDISGRRDALTSDAPLFARMKDSRKKMREALSGTYLNQLFKEYAADAALGREVTLHVLRHTAARMRHEAGQDIISLKNWLGHAHLETTYRYVQQLTPKSDDGAKLLEKRFSGL